MGLKYRLAILYTEHLQTYYVALCESFKASLVFIAYAKQAYASLHNLVRALTALTLNVDKFKARAKIHQMGICLKNKLTHAR